MSIPVAAPVRAAGLLGSAFRRPTPGLLRWSFHKSRLRLNGQTHRSGTTSLRGVLATRGDDGAFPLLSHWGCVPPGRHSLGTSGPLVSLEQI